MMMQAASQAQEAQASALSASSSSLIGSGGSADHAAIAAGGAEVRGSPGSALNPRPQPTGQSVGTADSRPAAEFRSGANQGEHDSSLLAL